MRMLKHLHSKPFDQYNELNKEAEDFEQHKDQVSLSRSISTFFSSTARASNVILLSDISLRANIL